MSESEKPVRCDMSDLEIADVRADDQGNITLTLPKEKFSEFLLGFLGPKETLSKSYCDDFIVKSSADVLQFHHLLEYKTKTQQSISLSLATATICYENGTNRTINTIESLEKFNEYRDLGVISFNLVWKFLFCVPNEKTIQQQKVSLLFNAKGTDAIGKISVSIEHTNQLWAVEVLRLFEEQINKIKVPYSFVYRALDTLSRIYIVGVLQTAAVVTLLIGGFYVSVQKGNFIGPVKVEAEFMFDLADVLLSNTGIVALTQSPDIVAGGGVGGSIRNPAGTAAPVAGGGVGGSIPTPVTLSEPNHNVVPINLLTQFFLIRDLRRSDHGVINHLHELGYFDAKYSNVIEKLKGGYYDNNDKSKTIIWSLKTALAQQRVFDNIVEVWSYLKILMLYVFSYLVVALYLMLFRLHSVIAITSKGVRTLEKQQRDKSNRLQIVFGVIASVIAAFIYKYGQVLFLL